MPVGQTKVSVTHTYIFPTTWCNPSARLKNLRVKRTMGLSKQMTPVGR